MSGEHLLVPKVGRELIELAAPLGLLLLDPQGPEDGPRVDIE